MLFYESVHINLLFLISKLPHLSDTLKVLNRVDGHISYSTDWRKQLSDPLKKEWSHITSRAFLKRSGPMSQVENS